MAALGPRSKGTSGTVLQVTTNAYEISQRPRGPYIHYTVFSPEIKSPRRAHEIIDRLQVDNAHLFNPRAAYDGKANLFCRRELPASSYEVCMSRDRNSERGRFIVKISQVAIIRPTDIDRLIAGPQAQTQRGSRSDANTSTMAINLLQIIVRQAPNMRHGFPPQARAFFVQRGAKDLSAGLQAWHGFFQSVRPVLGRLLINVDVANGVVYQPGPLPELAMKFLRIRDVRQLARLQYPSPEWTKLRNFIKGLLITVTTAGSGGKGRPIKDIVLQAGHYEFQKDGMSTTVEAHFLQQHNRRLQYPEIFGVRLSKTAVFPAEVCVVVPGQLYKKKLSPDDTTTFLRFATQKPEERLRLIRESVAGHNQIFDYHKSDFMQDAGMVVNPQPIQIRGRVLPTPQILYGQGQMNIKQKTGAWNVVGQQLVSPSRIKSWAIVVFDQSTELFAIQQFITKLTKNLKNLGLGVDQPKPHIEKGNAHNPQESLNKAGKKAVENMPPNTRPNLILVVLPSSAAALRKVVKQWGDVLCAIPTQCVRQGKWEQGSDQYCNNVALKINAKIGGVNSAIKSPVMSFLADAMVVGTDVGHPGPGVSSRPSITSLVASVDPYATRYAAYANVQSPRQEIIEELGNMFKKALKDYFDFQQGKLPSKIIFYRDGVSEGEYAQVAKVEVEAIECALREIPMFANPQVSKPKIVFIIVGKRHHIRFFPSSREAADSSGNCPSGFVVDDQITNSMYLDFYLQSHSGIIGTSRPSHYVVLRDELNMTADQLQELSFALCHVYASATRSVSIPAPVYYADRVCARAEFHFRPDLNFGESEVATTASGDAPLFDLDKWKQGFRESALNKRMYFL